MSVDWLNQCVNIKLLSIQFQAIFSNNVITNNIKYIVIYEHLWIKLPYLTQTIIYLRKYHDHFSCMLKPQLGYICIFQESYKLLLTTTSCCAYFKICSGQWWKLIILESWDTLQNVILFLVCVYFSMSILVICVGSQREYSGAHFTNYISIVIQIQWKILFSETQYMAMIAM